MPAWAAIFAAAAAVAGVAVAVVAAAAADAVASVAASESLLTCAGEAVVTELAAIAAAAIASGALADAGVAPVVGAGAFAGTLVGAVVTGIATATGCAAAVGSSAEASRTGFLADFWSPALAALEFAWDCRASPFAWESFPAEASSEPFCAAWLAAALLADGVLFAAANASSVCGCEAAPESPERLCDAGWVGVVAGAALLSA
ncbi:MAG TPA: hypothetical protein VJ226_00585, partial [Bradyrhizobium sp.]|nr:hypothetical protein [Bradyrhizobium sp.]